MFPLLAAFGGASPNTHPGHRFFIPPVVCCLFSTYAMLAMTGVLHRYDIISCEGKASDLIIALRERGGLTIGGFGIENELERQQAEDALLCSLENELAALQQKMDRTCEMTNSVTVHYLAVCLLQVITTFCNLREGFKPTGSYSLTHGAQDFFHFAAGATGVGVLVGCGGYVTIRTTQLGQALVRCCRRGASLDTEISSPRTAHGASQQALATMRSMVQATLQGFNFAGLPVDVQKMVMFSWALCCLVAGLVAQMAVAA
jgi:hypothetical protein